MAPSFDPYEYWGHVRARWRFIAVACVTAATLTLLASLLLPKKYTAVSRIMIDPPAGSDLRAATAVSPIYLESLKTYELFASGDDLFFKAAQHFGLRKTSGPIEKLKRSVLKVVLQRNTKILEVAATLTEASKAHDLALYIAEETVKLNRAVYRESDLELAADAEQRLQQARAAADEAERAWAKVEAQEPVDALVQQLESSQILKSRLQEDLYSAELDTPEDKKRVERLRAQIAETEREIARTDTLLAQRSVRRVEAKSRLDKAEAVLKAAQDRWRETTAAVGYRGERLRVVDPGIVPERPSSPNIPLNVIAALFIGLIMAVLYVSMEFSYRVRKDFLSIGRPL